MKVFASLVATYALTNGQVPPATVTNLELVPEAAAVQATTAAPRLMATTMAAEAIPPAVPEPIPPVAPEPEPQLPAATSPPVTPTPTDAPTQYVNRHCPPGAGVGSSFGPMSQDQACMYPGQVAQDFQGVARCNDYSCCKCEHITCGYFAHPCEALQFGDHGAIGVRSIWLDGRFMGNGATLECDGLLSCSEAVITGNDVWKASCGADQACKNGKLSLYNPRRQFEFGANGQYSLQGGELEIIMGAPGTVCPPGGSVGAPAFEINKIELTGFQAGLDATIRVKNYGCDAVLIRNLQCGGPTACPNTVFELEGNIQIETCFLPGINPQSLPPSLQACAMGYGGQQLPPQQPLLPGTAVPPAFTPLQPATPAQATPATPAQPQPVTPAQPQPLPQPQQPQTATPPAAPINPAQQQPGAAVPGSNTPPILAPGSPAKLVCDSIGSFCAGQTFSIQVENNFALECNQPAGCSGMTLNVPLGIDPHTGMPVERIEGIKCVKEMSCAGSTVHFTDARPVVYPGMPRIPIEVNDIRCEMEGSCVGLTITAGPGVDLVGANFDCSEPRYCAGCTYTANGITVPCAGPQAMQMPMPLTQPGPQQQPPATGAAPQQPFHGQFV